MRKSSQGHLDLKVEAIFMLTSFLLSGSGSIRQDISRSYDYYVAVGNLNTEEVEVFFFL